MCEAGFGQGRVLKPNSVVAVDNPSSHRGRVAPFRALLTAAPEFDVHLHEVGDGVLTGARIPVRRASAGRREPA